MRSRHCTALFIAAVSSVGIHCLGAAEEKKAFPEVGSRLPGAFSVLVINGKWVDQDNKPVNRFHSPVTEFGLKPTVLVFVKKGHHTEAEIREIRAFLKKLDAKIDDTREASLNACVVFLDHDSSRKEAENFGSEEKVEKLKDQVNALDNVIKDLKGLNPKTEPLALKRVVVGIGPSTGPKGYRIDSSKVVTVLLHDKFRVKAHHIYKKGELDDKAAEKLLKEIDKLLLGAGKKKSAEAEK
jgi:hypothetical protein